MSSVADSDYTGLSTYLSLELCDPIDSMGLEGSL